MDLGWNSIKKVCLVVHCLVIPGFRTANKILRWKPPKPLPDDSDCEYDSGYDSADDGPIVKRGSYGKEGKFTHEVSLSFARNCQLLEVNATMRYTPCGLHEHFLDDYKACFFAWWGHAVGKIIHTLHTHNIIQLIGERANQTVVIIH